jgi:adenylate cyclase
VSARPPGRGAARRRRGRAILAGLAAALAALAAHAATGGAPLGARVAGMAADLRLQLRGADTAPDERFLIVRIDDPSIAELGRWPWPRDRLAALVARLHEAGARVVALDLLMTEPDRDPAADAALAAAMRASGRVVLPVVLAPAGGGPADVAPAGGAASAALEAAAFRAIRPLVPDAPVPRGALVAAPVAPLADAAAALGHVNLFPDPDGRVRDEALAVAWRDLRLPSLTLAAARLALGLEPAEMRLELGCCVRLGRRFVPTDPSGRTPVSWRGGPERFPWVSASDVVAGRMDAGRAADRIVLVGATATGVADRAPTPFASAAAGVERQAEVVRALIDGDALSRGPETEAAGIALVALAGIAGAAAGALLPGIAGVLAALAVAAGAAALAQAAFLAGVVLPLVGPAAAALAAGWTAVAAQVHAGREEARRVRRAFAHYLHPDLVDRLADDPDGLVLGGELRDLAVLFCDVRGFTAIAERLEPQELIAFLNAVLERMAAVVIAHRGYVDKFTGDGLMAVFGAPAPTERPALDACRAAVAMVADVRAHARLWARWGVEDLRIGVGISAGPMAVGNVGAAERFDYTVLGDAVNLAARLEQATKDLGVAVAVSEAALRAAGPGVAARPLGEIAVRGRTGRVRVWALAADDAAAGPLPRRRPA